MQSSKMLAPLLALFALTLFPTPAHSQAAPSSKGIFARIGQPDENGEFYFTLLVRKDDGSNFKQWTEEPRQDLEGGTTPGKTWPPQPVLEFRVRVIILANESVLEKAEKIRAAFYKQLANLDLADQDALRLKMLGLVNDGGDLVYEMVFCNGRGHKLSMSVVNRDETGEKDAWSNLKDIQYWLDGGMTTPDQFPDDEEETQSLHSENPIYGAVLTDDTSVTFDLSGTPAGGMVHVEVGGERLFSVDTWPYTMDPFGAILLEMDISNLMNMHPLIETEIRGSLLSPNLETEENPFDGVCVEILALGSYSYAIDIDDIGLTLRSEVRFDDELFHVGTRYCEATLNSTGSPSNLWARMDGDITSDTLYLEADRVPEQFGLFFCGPNQIQMPFGNGFRCVGGGVVRLTSPQIATGNQASAEVDVELLPLELSTELNLQYWYRDPQGGGANFNLSDALNVVR